MILWKKEPHKREYSDYLDITYDIAKNIRVYFLLYMYVIGLIVYLVFYTPVTTVCHGNHGPLSSMIYPLNMMICFLGAYG
jgi:hypothetical protein